MIRREGWLPLLLVAVATTCSGGAACAADAMVTTADLLKDPAFESAFLKALGPRAKEKWLATVTNSVPVRSLALAGTTYQVATPCKPHDCADNNLMLLYGRSGGVVYGKLYEKGRVTMIGAPNATLAKELEVLWKKEFRQP